MMVIAYVDLPLEIVDAASVANTFKRVTVATVSSTVASTGLNSVNLSGKLILWHL